MVTHSSETSPKVWSLRLSSPSGLWCCSSCAPWKTLVFFHTFWTNKNCLFWTASTSNSFKFDFKQTARSNPLHRRCRRCQAWRSPVSRAWKTGNLMSLINLSFFDEFLLFYKKIMFLCDFVIFQYLSYWILNLILALAWLHRCRGFAMIDHLSTLIC